LEGGETHAIIILFFLASINGISTTDPKNQPRFL